MQSKPKANSVVTSALVPEGATHSTATAIRFTVEGGGVFDLPLVAVHPDNLRRATIHGLVQRVSDRAAKGRDPNTGKAAPAADRFAAMKSLADHLASGSAEWSPARAEGGATGLDSIILGAVVEVTGKTREEIRALIAVGAERQGIKPSAFLAALGASAKVAPVVARIRGEAAGVDGNELLEQLVLGEGAEAE